MNMFRKLDTDLLDLFQKFSDKIQIFSGIDCLKQGLISHSASSLLMAWFMLEALSFRKLLTPSLIVNSAVLVFLFFSVGYLMYEITKRIIDNQTEEGLRNVNYIDYYPGRKGFWMLFPLFFLMAVGYDISALNKLCVFCFGVFSVSFVYLLSCTPLPPGKSKIKKLIESLFVKKEATGESVN